jgi:hypothetical protein
MIDTKIRWGWLKAMYIYTIVTAGGLGLAMLAFPGLLHSLFGFPAQEPTTLKLYGSIVFAAGLVAVPALRFPLKFVPLLLLQVVYKPIWIVLGALPFFLKGQFPFYIVTITTVFLVYIVGDLIAIPWRYLFGKRESASPGSEA